MLLFTTYIPSPLSLQKLIYMMIDGKRYPIIHKKIYKKSSLKKKFFALCIVYSLHIYKWYFIAENIPNMFTANTINLKACIPLSSYMYAFNFIQFLFYSIAIFLFVRIYMSSEY